MKTFVLTVSLLASVLAGAVAAQAVTHQTGHFNAAQFFADQADRSGE